MKRIICVLIMLIINYNIAFAINYDELYFTTEKKIGLVYYTQPDYNISQKALLTSISLNLNSNVAIVRNATRYLDVENIRLIPKIIDGRTYIPVEFMSKAFKFYYEESPLLFRDDNLKELVLPFLNIDNLIYMPLREVATFFGKKVHYDSGLIIIDSEERINNILKNSAIANSLRNIMKPIENEGNTYYVSQNETANDTNPGTNALPFRSLNWAGSVAKAGDTVIVAGGTYNELFSPKNNGTPNAPITFKAADKENVVINRAVTIKGFTKYKNNIYVAPVNVDLGRGRNQVFKDGMAVPEARHPNEKNSKAVDVSHLGLSNMWPIQGDIKVSASEPFVGKGELSLNQNEQNYWEGATFVAQSQVGWCLNTAIVSASKKGEITLGTTSPKWWFPSFGMEWGGEDFGYLTGHMNALDIADEWIIKDNKIYYCIPEDVDANNFTVQVKTDILVMNLNNRQNLILDGINFFGGSVTMDNTKMCMIKNSKIDYISHFTYFKEARDGYIDEGSVTKEGGSPQAGKVGIYSNGDSNVFYNCVINNSAGAAIFETGRFSLIQNNKIKDCGYGGTYVSGVYISYDPRQPQFAVRGGHELYNNSIGNAPRSVFNIHNNETMFPDYSTPYVPIEVAYNDFYNGGVMSGRDGAVLNSYLVSLGDHNNKSRIHNNTIMDYYGNDDNHMGAGIYYDSGTYMLESFNNVIFYTNDNARFTKPYYNNLIIDRDWLSIVSAWNQTAVNKRPNGKSDLTAIDYPSGIPFVSGLKTNTRPKLNDDGWSAPQSESVAIVDGFAFVNKNAETIKYENVDFKDGSNRIGLLVKGDRNKPINTFEVRIDTNEGRPLSKFSYDIETANVFQTDTVYVDIPLKKGVHNLYITALNVNETKIGKIFVDKKHISSKSEFKYDEVSVDVFNPSQMGQLHPDKAEAAPTTSTQAGLGSCINNTWLGNWFKYEKVNFKYETNIMTMVTGTQEPYNGNIAEILIDGLNSEPVGRVEISDGTWGSKTTRNVKLIKPIPAGEHTIYVRMAGPAGKSSNIYEIGFGYFEADE